jgi:hypothetical protein
VKQRALENLRTAGVRTTLVSTLAKGVNDQRIGECVRLLLEHDFILSLMFQPAAYTGYGGAHFAPHNPLDVITIPDVVRHCEEQSGGALLRISSVALPHPSCFALTYLLKTGGAVPAVSPAHSSHCQPRTLRPDALKRGPRRHRHTLVRQRTGPARAIHRSCGGCCG